ncbi:MAG: hypothetical protein L3J96_02145 [Thermoplasmata archaeon]|nr:hypothetical protein [Thermoplasmata archaeon]
MPLTSPADFDSTFRLMESIKRKQESNISDWKSELEGMRGAVYRIQTTVKQWKEATAAGQLAPTPQSFEEYTRNIDPALQAADHVIDGMAASERELGAFGGLLAVNKGLAELYTTVVSAWPDEGFAKTVIAVGSALLGLGGASFAALGYPSNARLAIPAFFWAAGIMSLGFGMYALWTWQQRRMRFFESRLGILEAAGKYPPVA